MYIFELSKAVNKAFFILLCLSISTSVCVQYYCVIICMCSLTFSCFVVEMRIFNMFLSERELGNA